MSKITDIKKDAKQYPGSYELGVSGRTKVNGLVVTFVAYTNPQNITANCYVGYAAGGKEYSITSTTLDIYNLEEVKAVVIGDLTYKLTR